MFCIFVEWADIITVIIVYYNLYYYYIFSFSYLHYYIIVIIISCSSISYLDISGFIFPQKCHVKKKDIRKFLDGIYVSEKGQIVEEEWSVRAFALWVVFAYAGCVIILFIFLVSWHR